ncbi:hypothetical protein CC86DRAFT_66113 [Ophiobolus disseminans]|uniref:Uncharacterized protein n=1 Tax=Ophiobolus disseminans TaxID=1469910 RepID=A0A6A6ZRU5_9PLEO|nr:hypothetical protein CC86DRAFT_66113 [Ophiobolus disseminans]
MQQGSCSAAHQEHTKRGRIRNIFQATSPTTRAKAAVHRHPCRRAAVHVGFALCQAHLTAVRSLALEVVHKSQLHHPLHSTTRLKPRRHLRLPEPSSLPLKSSRRKRLTLDRTRRCGYSRIQIRNGSATEIFLVAARRRPCWHQSRHSRTCMWTEHHETNSHTRTDLLAWQLAYLTHLDVLSKSDDMRHHQAMAPRAEPDNKGLGAYPRALGR